jgi:hypothetical protein
VYRANSAKRRTAKTRDTSSESGLEWRARIEDEPAIASFHEVSVRQKPHSDKSTHHDLAQVVTWCGSRGLLTVCRQSINYLANPPENEAFFEDSQRIPRA